MDDIQRTLVRAGRKDLAKKYYNKITAGELTDKDVDAVHSIMAKAYKQVVQKYPAIKKEKGFMKAMGSILDWVSAWQASTPGKPV